MRRRPERPTVRTLVWSDLASLEQPKEVTKVITWEDGTTTTETWYRPKTMFDCLESEPFNFNLKQLLTTLNIKYGSLPVLPDLCRCDVEMWCESRVPVWAKLKKTMEYDYNPTHNYDRTEEITVERKHSRDTLEQSEGESSSNGENVNTGTNNRNSSTSQQTDKKIVSSVSAYNSEDFANREKNVGTDNVSNNESGSENGKYTSTGFTNDKNSAKRKSGEVGGESVTTRHTAYGNIGVTTTQEMIEAERKVVMFNLIDIICDEFKNMFCVMIY